MNNNHFDKLINTRNAIIALIIMLILLLSLQAPLCCDGVVTSELTLPSVVEQPQRPAQIPPAPTKKSAAKTVKPVATKAEPVKTAPALVVAAAVSTEAEPVVVAAAVSTEAEPVVVAAAVSTKAEPVVVAAAVSTKAEPVVAAATEPEMKLAAIAPASGPEPAVPAVKDENIKADAAATLATVVESGFVKIADSGEELDKNVANWECVEDKGNNLVWEIKKNDGGLRDKDYSYSWLRNINGENIGVGNNGRCKGGVNCDTYSYVRAMNEQKLCGYSDWRLPTREELETLVEYTNNAKEATINKTYFPEAVPSWYWTASENPKREGYAWYVLFRNGVALNDLKERPKHIRLVRGNIQQ